MAAPEVTSPSDGLLAQHMLSGGESLPYHAWLRENREAHDDGSDVAAGEEVVERFALGTWAVIVPV